MPLHQVNVAQVWKPPILIAPHSLCLSRVCASARAFVSQLTRSRSSRAEATRAALRATPCVRPARRRLTPPLKHLAAVTRPQPSMADHSCCIPKGALCRRGGPEVAPRDNRCGRLSGRCHAVRACCCGASLAGACTASAAGLARSAAAQSPHPPAPPTESKPACARLRRTASHQVRARRAGGRCVANSRRARGGGARARRARGGGLGRRQNAAHAGEADGILARGAGGRRAAWPARGHHCAARARAHASERPCVAPPCEAPALLLVPT